MNIIFSTETLAVAPLPPSPPCRHHPFSSDHHRLSRTAVNTTCLTAIKTQLVIIIAQPFFFLASSSHLAATHCRFFVSPFQPKTHKSIQCGSTKSPIATTSFPRTNVIRHREREPERDLLPRPLSSSSLPNRNEPLAATTKAPLSVKLPAAERRPPCASRRVNFKKLARIKPKKPERSRNRISHRFPFRGTTTWASPFPNLKPNLGERGNSTW
ncbi:hypothetical protein LR48_Vigan312s001600 [Vigna angularis]|uniref:Uncharacterized protein n=1 Tax=Phaseolus angularis TaxID=3914 RepID=A0A0L9T821_PHAAN|nr:hypothetical protein LR48_Vigan312s001600 [Vigna angularis]